IINQSVPPALTRLGYSPKQIEDIIRYSCGTGSLKGSPHINFASLIGKGVPQDVIDTVEAQLPTAFELQFAFNRFSMGDEVLLEKLGFTKSQIDMPGFDVLSALGFTREQIAEAS